MPDRSFRILLVDDLEENRMLLEVILEDNYELLHAASGHECLDIVNHSAPDLILLDVTMPGMDGYEVCHHIKSNAGTADIPIIFVSARVSPEERLAGFEAGGDDYVTKPVDDNDLLKKVEESLSVRAENLKIKDSVDDAMNVAMEAMVSSSELGTLNQFLRDCAASESYRALADALFEVTRSFGLNCSFQFRPKEQVLNFGCEDDSLDSRLLSKSVRGEKIMDFEQRTVVSVPTAGILIKNMPVGERAKYGRLKDHLAVLIDSVESKIDALIITMNMQAHRAKLVENLIEENDQQLAEIRTKISDRDSERRQIMMGLLNSVEEQLFSLGLDDDQEKHLMGMLDSGVQQVTNLPDFGAEIEASFATAQEKLKTLLDNENRN